MIKTKLGAEIPENIRGVFYICELEDDIKVLNEILCESSSEALNLYSNIPNPESQLVMGRTHKELLIEVDKLNHDLDDPKWVTELKECI